MERREDGSWERRVREVTWQLQQLTGRSARQVLLDALEHRLAVMSGPATAAERVQVRIGRLGASPGACGRRGVPSAADQARALGYGEKGV